ncbi:unnamed protein product, partial [Rotaria magnacalcarata]
MRRIGCDELIGTLPSSSYINDRYYFCSHSTMNKKSKYKSDTTPPSLRKRYKFSSGNG